MSKITFICPIYNTFPEIISSCINQTHKDWTLLLIHDGPNSTNLKQLIDVIGDDRIKFIETEERKEYWGHPVRKWALENIDILAPGTEYIVVTNDDNHHVPHYCEYLLKGFKNPSVLVTYCSQFVLDYESWQRITPFDNLQKKCNNIEWKIYEYGVFDTRLILGYIDSACVMMRKHIAVESGWTDMHHSSDFTFFKRVIDKYGEGAWNKVYGCLMTHN